MTKRKAVGEWVTRIVLMVIGIAIALSIVVVAAPYIIRDGNARYANVDLGEVEYSVGTGDLFLVQAGSIAPPEDPYEVLSRHRLGWDKDGFRVPTWRADEYSIIALGDSYTEATNVARPWPDVLAHEVHTPVRNLGFRGYGPQEEAIVFEEFGLAENPEIVVIGFFGGNDVSNAGSFDEREDTFEFPALLDDLVMRFDTSGKPWESDNTEFQFPVTLQLNEQTQVPMAFFNSYTSWLNVTADDLRQSKNLEEIIASWQAIQNTADPETCIILAFFPSKPQIYLPFIVPEQETIIIGGMIQRTLDAPGQVISRADIHPTWDELMSRRDNMRTVIGEAAQAQGLHFVDVSDAFTAAAENGEVLYYTYDTHWNQAGHDLAGSVIGDFLRDGGCD